MKILEKVIEQVFGDLANVSCYAQEKLNSLGEGIDYQEVLADTSRGIDEVLDMLEKFVKPPKPPDAESEARSKAELEKITAECVKIFGVIPLEMGK